MNIYKFSATKITHSFPPYTLVYVLYLTNCNKLGMLKLCW